MHFYTLKLYSIPKKECGNSAFVERHQNITPKEHLCPSYSEVYLKPFRKLLQVSTSSEEVHV